VEIDLRVCIEFANGLVAMPRKQCAVDKWVDTDDDHKNGECSQKRH